MGLAFKFSLKNLEAGKSIEQLRERITHSEAMLREVGLYMLSSIQRNFKEGGRPVRWKPSRRAIDQHGKTLVDTGRLKNSITMKVVGKLLTIGTNVKYAQIHQFGGILKKAESFSYRVLKPGTKKTYTKRYVYLKAGTKIPARPFLVIQNEDYRIINRIAGDYLHGKIRID